MGKHSLGGGQQAGAGKQQETNEDYATRQHDGLRALMHLAEANDLTERYEKGRTQQRLTSLNGAPPGKADDDPGRSTLWRDPYSSHNAIYAYRKDSLPSQETISGALNPSYPVPSIRFSRRPVWTVSAVIVLILSVAAWKVFATKGHAIHWQLVALALPAALLKAYGWILSIFDKPVKTDYRQQRVLDRLRVVVSIPVYNEDPPLLDRCLYALVNQSRPPQRIDVVDDGSTKVDYTKLRSYWEGWHGQIEVTWTEQENAGKRRAHTRTFTSDPLADVFITVDSDTTLVRNAIEEGIKPFADSDVQSVAGIELGYNASLNFITLIQNSLQQLSQAVLGAAWSVTGDMYTNRGPFALYRAPMVRDLVPLYWGETLFGHRVVLGDDSLLALAGSMAGRSVQQLSAFGLTMWPETVDHHIRQRVRWARGRTVRNFWRLKYYPLRSYLFWYSVMGIYGYIASIEIAFNMVRRWPHDTRTIGIMLLAFLSWSWISQLRCLCFQRDDESWLDRVLVILVRPVASLWSAIVLNRAVRTWGTCTFLQQGWTTRQEGVEITLDPERRTTSTELALEGVGS